MSDWYERKLEAEVQDAEAEVDRLASRLDAQFKRNAALTREIQALKEERDRLVRVLRECEWGARDSRCMSMMCPWCESREHDGHNSDCMVKLALEIGKDPGTESAGGSAGKSTP